MLQAHPLEYLIGAPALLLRRSAEHAHHERDVVEYGLGRDQLEVLKHHAERTTVGLNVAGGQRCQILVANPEGAFRRHLLAQKQAQEGRLARTTGPRQEHELAFRDAEGEVVQGQHVGSVDLRDVVQLDH